MSSQREDLITQYIDQVEQVRTQYALTRASAITLLRIIEERLHIEQHSTDMPEPDERTSWIQHYIDRMEEVRVLFPGWTSKYAALQLLFLVERRIHAEEDAELVRKFGRFTGL